MVINNELSHLNSAAFGLLRSPNLTLQDLCTAFPKEWPAIEAKICRILELRDPQKILDQRKSNLKDIVYWQEKIKSPSTNKLARDKASLELVRCKMASLAFDEYFNALRAKDGTKPAKQTYRFSALAVRFFHRHLSASRRNLRPLPDFLARNIWNLISPQHKSKLLESAYRHGAYCIYTRSFVRSLSRLIGDRLCLEIGSGDGSLASYLKQLGTNIVATDDFSWESSISYGQNVEKIDARSALKKFKPKLVLSSWPPDHNNYERHILASPDIDTYIVLGSRHAFATGDHDAYSSLANFSWECDLVLTNLLFPREIDGCVYIFNSRTSQFGN